MAVDGFEIGAEYRFKANEFDDQPFTFVVTDIVNDKDWVNDARVYGVDQYGQQECMVIDDEWHRSRCTLISPANPAIYQPEDWS